MHHRRSSGRLTALVVLAALAPVLVAATATAGEFPGHYYFHSGRGASATWLRGLEGKPAPELTLTDWIGEPQRLEDLDGKIVVVDFWATWCGPCMRALPKNRALAAKYRDDVVFIGVHDSKRGVDRMPRVVESLNLGYPVAVDVDRASEQAWRVGFWPTYAVIDRHGIVRAIGLTPNSLEPVIQHVMANDRWDGGIEGIGVPPAGTAIPDDWLEGDVGHRRRLERLFDEAAAPPLDASTWINSPPLDLAALRGKVVLIDFWATWCTPCIRAIPHTNELARAHADEGLVVIGVCHPKGVDRMDEVARTRAISYPICADEDGRITAAYGVNGFPDYFLIDRSGRLRIADCHNDAIEYAVKYLLREPAPGGKDKGRSQGQDEDGGATGE